MSKLSPGEELARKRQDLIERAGLLGVHAIKDLLHKYIPEARDLEYIEKHIKKMEERRDTINKEREES